MTAPTIHYVVSPHFSGVSFFATEAEATAYAAEHAGELIPAAQVDPDVRAIAADRLARAALAERTAQNNADARAQRTADRDGVLG